MRILITGVDGFLGRRIAAALRLDGHEIYGISAADTAPDDVTFKSVDIRDRQRVFEAVSWARADLCIHLAAKAHADVSAGKERSVTEVNVDGAFHVLDALEAAGTGDVIYFSTAKVLADTTPPEGIDENALPEGTGVYAESKRTVEAALLARTDEKRLRGVVVRPTAVIGPDDAKGNYAKMIRSVERGFFPVLGGGTACRSIVFLRTLVERILRMTRDGLRPGRCYVFSDGAFTVREIVDAARDAVGFSFCPNVPVAVWRGPAKVIDAIGQAVLGRRPAEQLLKRLDASFVIQPHNWEDDYGPRTPINLSDEMAFIAGVKTAQP